jgi:hypothetical protein
MRKIILAALLFTLFISCDKNKEKLEEGTGILHPFALDGCVNVITLEDGKRLEPVSNLSGVEMEINKRFIIRYRLKPAFSICMSGETVEIVSLRYL